MGKHFVPQELLRGFAHPVTPELIWQFDKQTGRFSAGQVPIKKVANRRDFYPPEIEDKLTKLVENPGNAVIRKIRAGRFDLSDPERLDLAIYIGTMITRVPRNRNRARDAAPGALSKVVSELRQLIQSAEGAGVIDGDLAQARVAEADAVAEEFAKELPKEIVAQMESPWPTERMVQCIYDMEWRFLQAHGSHMFVTSDNPAFFFECWGLRNENGMSELTFPISANLALFGSWSPIRRPQDSVCKDRQIAKEANSRILSAATRFVYSRSKADWIPRLAAKTPAELNRVEWYPDQNIAGITLRPGRAWF
jgi:Protein of unknown function (DUF4238)